MSLKQEIDPCSSALYTEMGYPTAHLSQQQSGDRMRNSQSCKTDLPRIDAIFRRCAVRGLSLTVALLTTVGISSDPAQAQPRNSKQPSSKIEQLTTRDGWPIEITYFRSNAEDRKESPVVVLLHRLDPVRGSRLIWKNGFAKRLQQQRYAVVTVDLRKHGKSNREGNNDSAGKMRGRKGNHGGLRPLDYFRMITEDLETVKTFILSEHHKEQLNVRKMAIIATEESAPIALNFSWNDWLKIPYDDGATFETRTPKGQDIRAIILLSPVENLPRTPSRPALASLRNPEWDIAFLIINGAQDKLDRGNSQRIYKKLIGKGKNQDRVYFKEYENLKLRGTDMLGKKINIEKIMLGFLSKHLQGLPDTWQRRRSRAL